MYAVIMTGGKQYRVSQGDKVRVEKLDAAEGDSIELDKVLMVVDGDDIKIGAPVLDGGKVTAQVKAHGRGDKVEIIKFRRRKHHMKRQGHRQDEQCQQHNTHKDHRDHSKSKEDGIADSMIGRVVVCIEPFNGNDGHSPAILAYFVFIV